MRKRSKELLRELPPGSPEYVLEHALWRAKKGKPPSMAFGDIREPRKAIIAARAVLAHWGVSFPEDFEHLRPRKAALQGDGEDDDDEEFEEDDDD